MSLGTLIVGGIFVLVGLAFVAGGGKQIWSGIQIKRSDPISIREVAQDTGVDEFEGIIEPTEDYGIYQAPFSGGEAVASTYKVERRERKQNSNNNGSNTTWRTETRGELTRPFLVSDETGRVEVDPAGADISPANTDRRHTTGGSLPDAIRLRLSVLTDQLDLSDILAQDKSKKRRYTEGYIGPGDEVHIYGTRLAERTPQDPAVDARVENAPESGIYTISAGTEANTVKRAIGSGIGLAIFGLFFAALGTGAMFATL